MTTDERARRVAELFRATLDRDPEERLAYVRDACRDSPSLRAEVESLLSLHAEGSSFLDHLPAAQAAFLQSELELPEAIEPGTRLGDYRVDHRIGAGGMGIVYQAHDSRLGRSVAIKVLSPHLVSSQIAVRRLDREARLLASLNHPNVATIHGVEECGETRFLVLELVAGQTLRDRLDRGALPFPEALEICRQIARGLEAAHTRGVIHRDLKPANIKITPEGNVKLLDFGLAKLIAADGAADARTKPGDPLAGDVTRDGLVQGTAAYMSPEQARGEELDKRTDIWSFACVMYEALSGIRAFPGRTLSDTIAAVIERDPDWSLLPAEAPEPIVHLLRRCLRKDRERRLHDIADARIELEETTTYSAASELRRPASGPASRSRRSPLVLWLVVVLVSVVLAALAVRVFVPWREAPAARARYALSVLLPESAPLVLEDTLPASIGRPSIALSPDASRLVYVAGHGPSRQLYVRSLDRFDDEHPIPGTEGGFSPFFEPDGEWIGFFTEERLYKVSLRGARPVPICEANHSFGGTWNERGDIVFASNWGSLLSVVPSSGRSPPSPVERKSTENGRWPRFLPDGRAVVVSTGELDPAFMILAIPSGDELARIDEAGTRPLYAQGRIIFGRRGDLYACPFDVERLEITGSPAPMITGVRTSDQGVHQTAVSNDGTLAFVPGPLLGKGTLVWVDHEGTEVSVAVAGQRFYGPFQISPDGKRVAATVMDILSQIWIFQLDGSHPPLRLTSETHDFAPVWLDEERVVFTSVRRGRRVLLSRRADGTDEPEALLPRQWSGGEVNKPRSVSVDRRFLLFDAGPDKNNNDSLWVYDLEAAQVRPFLQTPSIKGAGVFSPDGKWVAFSGDSDVFVCRFPDGDELRQLSSGGGEETIWSEDGDVFYRKDNEWWKVSREGGPSERLFGGPYLNTVGISYDYDRRRKQFLMVHGVGRETPPREIRVILPAK